MLCGAARLLEPDENQAAGEFNPIAHGVRLCWRRQMRFVMPQFTRRAIPHILGAGLLLCIAAPHAAKAAPADEAAQMADFLTGVLDIDVPGGDWSAKRFFAADHTYRETGSDGQVTGTWKVQDSKICTTADRPLGLDRARTYCNSGLGRKAGEAWRDQDPVTGNTVMFKLTAGRPGR
jgi:hypothetical protein